LYVRILIGSISPKTRVYPRRKSCVVFVRQSDTPAGFFKLPRHQRYVFLSRHFFSGQNVRDSVSPCSYKYFTF